MQWNFNQNCFKKENHWLLYRIRRRLRCRWISRRTRRTHLFRKTHLDRETRTNFQRLKMCSSTRGRPRTIMTQPSSIVNSRHPQNRKTNLARHMIIHSTKSHRRTITSKWAKIGRKIIHFCRKRFTVMMKNTNNLPMSNYRSIRFKFREINNFSPYHRTLSKEYLILPQKLLPWQEQWNQ